MLTSILFLAVLGAVFGLGLGWAATRFRVDPDPVISWIDTLLPQTQCGRCGYPGCKPYAEAITSADADINQCPPGGDAGILALASLLGREPKPLNPENGELLPPKVVIDEQRCIGCTLCIQACPVDAIIGASRLMHTVIDSECTGCKLCLPPCPVDCIDIVEATPGIDLQEPVPGYTAAPRTEMPCINCGECTIVCPASLWPQQLHMLISNGQAQQAAEYGLSACIECGDCDTVCPSYIPLLEWFRYGKTEQWQLEVENQTVHLARKRFKDRNARLLRQQKEKTEKMRQRKQMLQDKSVQQERIRASIARAQLGKHAKKTSDASPP